jgi:formylglycine-generating enzyme required for sulfatase activity
MTEDYDLATIRQLLLAAFTANELHRFCTDRPTFRPVVDNLGPGHGLNDMVDEILTYCEKRLLFDELLFEVRHVNPRQYAHFLGPEPRGAERDASARPLPAQPGDRRGSQMPHWDCLDFDLQIEDRGSREYSVAVLQSPAGEAREAMRFPLGDLALENRLLTLQTALLRSGGPPRRRLSQEERAVQQFGAELFDTVFVGEVRTCYAVSREKANRQRQGLRLKLRIQPPELAGLPWEYLYDAREGDYLCLSRTTPIVRYLDLPRGAQPLPVRPPLRILGMIARPHGHDRLDVDTERQRIERATEHLQARGLVELTWLEGQTWRHLQRAMRRGRWHLFHFIGHGGFHRYDEESYLILADDEGQPHYLNATQVGRLLAGHRSLRFVLLNSCEGARGSERDVFSSTAATLIRRGIPAVLAMQYEITDGAAIEFARAFYEAVTEAMPVDAAVAEARIAVSMAVSNTVEWGVPVLYTHAPELHIFRAGTVEAVEPREDREAGQPVEPGPEALAVASPSVREVEEPRAKEPALSASDRDTLTITSPITLDLVRVPAGEFQMGSDKARDKDAEDDELPQHPVYVSEFYIGKYPVTNEQYQAFVKANRHRAPYHWAKGRIPQDKEHHPVVNVSWTDAVAFCRWLSKETGQPFRLPTEAEWEKAARGADGRIWPWGDEPPDERRCNFALNEGDTTAVGRYSPQGDSPYGCADMAGNVWEWCQSLSRSYPYQAHDGREAVEEEGPRVLRGGAFYVDQRRVRCAYRLRGNPNSWINAWGFRVVVAPGNSGL